MFAISSLAHTSSLDPKLVHHNDLLTILFPECCFVSNEKDCLVVAATEPDVDEDEIDSKSTNASGAKRAKIETKAAPPEGIQANTNSKRPSNESCQSLAMAMGCRRGGRAPRRGSFVSRNGLPLDLTSSELQGQLRGSKRAKR